YTTQLELIYICQPRHEVLLADIPAKAYRVECTPATPFGIAVVVALGYRQLQKILVCIVVRDGLHYIGGNPWQFIIDQFISCVSQQCSLKMVVAEPAAVVHG